MPDPGRDLEFFQLNHMTICVMEPFLSLWRKREDIRKIEIRIDFIAFSLRIKMN